MDGFKKWEGSKSGYDQKEGGVILGVVISNAN
jgi:hypothetical protein